MNSSRRQFLARTAAGAAVVAGGSYAAGPAAALTKPLEALGTTRITALTGATVIDVANGRRNPHQTVLISGDRIIGVGRHLPVPRGATVIDVTGKFVIPGLADMHVHSGDVRASLPLYLVNGLTTVREMAGMVPDFYDWRDRIEAGTLLGPRMIVGSKIIDGDPTLWAPDLMSVLVVQDAAGAREAVRKVKAEGADFVKVYSRLNPTAYRAIVDEARKQRLTVHGHAPDQVSIKEVSNSGQRSIEHIHAVGLSSSGREAEIRRMLRAITVETGDYNAWFRQFHQIEWVSANSYSKARTADVFGTLRRNRTRVTPTLTMHNVLDMPDSAVPGPLAQKYLSASDLSVFDWVLEQFYKANRTPAEIGRQRQMWEYRKHIVRELFAHDVPILAGTDTGTAYMVPGFALHDELELLVEAGATPRQALYSATVEPAKFLGMQAELGSVEPRKIADLVVLDGDPLKDIRNTRRIHSVITRGRVITPAARRKMLADVEAAVKQPPTATALAAAGCCGTRTPGH